jgi:hypothetical protein
MGSSFSDSFSATADKVVSMREWQEQTKAANSHIIFEKGILANIFDRVVSIPLSIMAGSTMKGFFTDDKGEIYISGEAAQKLTSLITRFSPLAITATGKEHLMELNRGSTIGFDRCEDYSKKQLKPAR